ncbi:FkbM family methyltransferase [Inquilinus sp. NPDC058860]|uniref:FkbM family methyltransferase n=1 Tax=Inquilinus sp. NPDC058860 TaxID=3346652 RepID=UPI00369AC83C
MLEREDVLSACRIVLGREPENEAVLEHWRSYPSLAALGAELLRSEECRRRATLGDLPASTERWVCAEIRHGLRLWLNLMDLGVGLGALRDDWEAVETQFVLSQLGAGDCFVDIGANIGWFTVLGAHKVGPEGRVYAFEPRFDLMRRLRDSVAANGMLERCIFHNVALGNAEGEMEIAAVPSERNPGHSFLVRGELEPEAIAYGKVKIRRLDDFSFEKPVDLIKIDVEGAEAMVLAGGLGLLKRDKPFLVSEFFPAWLRKVSGIEPESYLNSLRDIGYRVFELTDSGVGSLIADLPTDADQEGFFTNVVATCEPKVFKLVEKTDQPPAPFMPPAIIDDSLQGLSQRIRSIELNLQRAEKLAVSHRNEVSEGLAALAQGLEASQQRHGEALATTQNLEGLARGLEIDQRRHGEELAAANRDLAAVAQGIDRLGSALDSRLILLQEDVEQKHRKLQQSNGAAVARLSQIESQLSALVARLNKKSLLKRIVREIRRPFRKRFWRRRRGGGSDPLVPRDPLKASRPPSAALPVSEAAPCLQGVSKPVAMIIDHHWPEPDRDSGSVDAVNLVRSLLECGYHVVFAVEAKRPRDPYYIEELRALGASPVGLEDAPNVQAFIEQQGQRVDLFVLTRVAAGGQYLELIRYNCPHAKIIFNTVDLHFLRERRMAQVANDPEMFKAYERTRDREEALVAKSDLTFVVSSTEEEILQASVPGCTTAVLPLARDIRRGSNPFEQRVGIGFVGGFEHTPNIDAVEYFLRDIWPKVRSRDPSLVFQIVGSNLPEHVLKGVEGNVKYLGSLPSIEDWFDALRLSIAPLRIGAGAKGKVASSLCNGLPCVISSIAAEGMHLASGAGVLIADNPDEFADHIVKIHSDRELWAKLAVETHRFAEARLSYENFRDVVRRSLTRLELPTFSFPPPRRL